MNRAVVTAGFVVVSFGVVRVITTKQPITPVIVGGYVFTVALAIGDAVGGPLSEIASALAVLAIVYILISEGGPVFSALMNWTKASSTKGAVTGAGAAKPPIYPKQPGQTTGD
jgi:hypothetical protein